MKDIDQPLEIIHGITPTASVIWLHGLGANGYDFQPIIPELGLPSGLPVRFIFPHASERPVTVNGGMVMPAWYDIFALDGESPVDVDGLNQSAERIRRLVQKEMERGVPEHRIVLAGFSQGGAVALHYLTHFHASFAGILALSTYLPAIEVEQEVVKHNRSIPVWMGHGLQDPVVQYHWGRESAENLQEMGFSVEWHEYSMPHSVSLEEISDIGVWLVARLG